MGTLPVISASLRHPSSLSASEPALWIYNPSLTEPRRLPTRLVWRFEVTAKTLLPIRQLVLINAAGGEVALSFNTIDTALNRLTYDVGNSFDDLDLPGTLVCDETNPTCTGGDTSCPEPVVPNQNSEEGAWRARPT